jgi:hypothetical protein
MASGVMTTPVLPLSEVCVDWDPQFDVLNRWSTNRLPKGKGVETVGPVPFKRPPHFTETQCHINEDEDVYLQVTAGMMPPDPDINAFLVTKEDVLSAVHLLLLHLQDLEDSNQQLEPTCGVKVAIFDGMLYLMDEQLAADPTDPTDTTDTTDPNNMPVAKNALQALQDLLLTEDEEVNSTVLALRQAAHAHVGTVKSFLNTHKLMFEQLDPWEYVAKGTYGCVVASKNPADPVHKIFMNGKDGVDDLQAARVVRAMDPVGEWSIVPLEGENYMRRSSLPARTIMRCGAHALPVPDVEFIDIPRAEITFDEITEADVRDRTFVHSLVKLFHGMSVMSQAGFMHFDIRGDNVMRHQGMFKYLDFGIAGNTPDMFEPHKAELLAGPNWLYPFEFFMWLNTDLSLDHIQPGHITMYDTWASRLSSVQMVFLDLDNGLTKEQRIQQALDDARTLRALPPDMFMPQMAERMNVWQLGQLLVYGLQKMFQSLLDHDKPTWLIPFLELCKRMVDFDGATRIRTKYAMTTFLDIYVPSFA